MIILPRLAVISESLQLAKRFYARKAGVTIDVNMKQVHQQMLRYVCPNATIKVDSDIYVKVCSVDPHTFPDGDAFIAKLYGGPVKNCTASMSIKVSDDESQVEVGLAKLTDPTDFHCELIIPIKAALDVNTRNAAAVENIFGDRLRVRAEGSVNVENIRAEKIELFSSEGDITSQGLLLGKCATIETQNKGNIILDKLQGDSIKCKTIGGNISTNCSYVELSEFQTGTGTLNLKNIHKKTVIRVEENGNLKMVGVHGNLQVLVNEGTIDLQLSELQGDNCIEANNLTSGVINISEAIEKSTYLDIRTIGDEDTTSITLDSTLEHLSIHLSKNKQQFKINDQEESSKLRVTSKSSITLGKSSWMDTMRLQMTPDKKL